LFGGGGIVTAHIPKVELHTHIEGTVTPALVRRFAAEHKMDIPDTLFDGNGGYAWSDFLGFLAAYDGASEFIRTAENYRDIIYEYLAATAKEGAIYVEVFTSVDHASRVGIPYDELVAALVRGIDDAERNFGIIGRMIVTCVRHLGPDQALKDAKTALEDLHPYVVGFGMGGDESLHTCMDFAPAFRLMNDVGLACTVHAGEVVGPESVIQALDSLPVTRIGHGVRSVEDPVLMERLAKENIILEVCPGSNLALGIYKNSEDHPLNTLRDAGIKVTLGSDDPPFFKTTIGAEYERAQNEFGLSDKDLIEISDIAITAAFVDDATKQQLRARL
jgi:adenosine deaminase